MSAAATGAPADTTNERRGNGKPGWMSIPGGPKEPNFQSFLSKLRALNAEKAALYDKLNALKGNGAKSDDPARQKFYAEQQEIRNKMTGLRDEQKAERDKARAKREEMQRIRSERRKIEAELNELSGEVGLFRDASDVEAAMDRLLYKMETGIGDLKAEKLCSKRLGQLEKVKGLLEQVAPMTEALEEYEDMEAALAAETRDVFNHLDEINKKITTTMEEKIKKDGQKGGFDEARQKLQKEREEILGKIRSLASKIDDLRKEFDDARKAWDEWRDVAKERYAAQQAQLRAEREQRRQEIEAKRKNERKMRRAAKKLNPYASEIEQCDQLSRFLKDKFEAAEQDAKKAERARKLAEFDAAAEAPKGQQLKKDDLDEDAWLFGDRSSKNAKQSKKGQAKQAPKSSGSASATSVQPLEQRQLHLPNDRVKQLGSVQVNVPSTFGDIKKTQDELAAKKKHYESFKKSLDEISTDESTEEDNDDQNNNDNDDPTVRAAASAVAAVIAAEQREQ